MTTSELSKLTSRLKAVKNDVPVAATLKPEKKSAPKETKSPVAKKIEKIAKAPSTTPSEPKIKDIGTDVTPDWKFRLPTVTTRPSPGQKIREIAKEIGSLKLFSEELCSTSDHVYPLGCPPLDIALGGGIYSGKIIEIFAAESNGKSSLALEFTKAFVRYWEAREFTDYGVLWVETESALDKARAAYMGCAVENFLIQEADTVEDCEDIVLSVLEKAKAKGLKLFIIWDTVAAAPTRNEKSDPNKFKGGVAEKPRVVKSFLRKVTNELGKTDSTMILVNQPMGGPNMGRVPETSGGWGIRFHSSVRLWLQVRGQIMRTLPNGLTVQDGIWVEVQQVKNKIIGLKQKVNICIMNEKGLDLWETSVTFLQETKLSAIKGGWKYLPIPKRGYWKEGQPTDPEIEDLAYQSSKQLREKIDTEYPWLDDWIELIIYKYHAGLSPIMKAKIIEKVWDLEIKFFGQRRTNLDEEEVKLASIMHKELIADIRKEEEKEAKK